MCSALSCSICGQVCRFHYSLFLMCLKVFSFKSLTFNMLHFVLCDLTQSFVAFSPDLCSHLYLLPLLCAPSLRSAPEHFWIAWSPLCCPTRGSGSSQDPLCPPGLPTLLEEGPNKADWSSVPGPQLTLQPFGPIPTLDPCGNSPNLYLVSEFNILLC